MRTRLALMVEAFGEMFVRLAYRIAPFEELDAHELAAWRKQSRRRT